MEFSVQRTVFGIELEQFLPGESFVIDCKVVDASVQSLFAIRGTESEFFAERLRLEIAAVSFRVVEVDEISGRFGFRVPGEGEEMPFSGKQSGYLPIHSISIRSNP